MQNNKNFNTTIGFPKLEGGRFDRKTDDEKAIRNIMQIYEALCEKGYNPVAQFAGFLLTEDPTYITHYNGARNIAGKLDREQVLNLMIKTFVEVHSKNQM